MLRSMAQHALPRYTFPASLGYQRSLLSILESSQAETYLFMPLDPGKGQILWTETMTPCTGYPEAVILLMQKTYEKLVKFTMKMMMRLLKLYLELCHLSMYKQ